MSVLSDSRALDVAWRVPEEAFDEWFAFEGDCPICDERSTLFAAIDIVIDGDQIAEACHGCGRVVRPFSWHDDDGLPVSYLGTIDQLTGLTTVGAWFESGEVRSVCEVDEDDPTATYPPGPMESGVVARAVLAHLVGIDVPELVWSELDVDLIAPTLASSSCEWLLDVDEIIDWLAANR